MPSLIYGTAWKTDATAQLVQTAITTGFRAIDTANQPKHYDEPLVGDALLALAKQGIKREELFVQTKFTPVDGQDHRIPYDPGLRVSEQVRQSFHSSLTHLHTEYVDAYLLHGPYSHQGLGDEDWEVWTTMEEIYTLGKAKRIGVSNINKGQLELLLKGARIAPTVVQNRCFAQRGWDRAVRELCRSSNIVYQGFSLLTANPFVWQDPQVQKIAVRVGKTPMQVIFQFAVHVGMHPLTGTTNRQHMQDDLQICDFTLRADELQCIETIGDY